MPVFPLVGGLDILTIGRLAISSLQLKMVLPQNHYIHFAYTLSRIVANVTIRNTTHKTKPTGENIVMWDVKALVAKLGGPGETHRILTEMTSEPLGPSATRNWVSRNAMSADWLAMVLVALREKDPNFDPIKYIKWI
jgi:hypothetical protein